ncbi:MAG: hypothetical protein GMKNLPBB_02478 [Myxococcota bacterium]|nr:hypothetical protein [Myxococcota bacterium]
MIHRIFFNTCGLAVLAAAAILTGCMKPAAAAKDIAAAKSFESFMKHWKDAEAFRDAADTDKALSSYRLALDAAKSLDEQQREINVREDRTLAGSYLICMRAIEQARAYFRLQVNRGMNREPLDAAAAVSIEQVRNACPAR